MSIRIRLISDFNTELFARFLQNSPDEPALDCISEPFGQVYPALLEERDAAGETTILWTRPEGTFPSFKRALALEDVRHEEVLEEVREFGRLAAGYARRVRHLLVASWILPPGDRGYGILDYRPNIGLKGLIDQMNLELARQLAEVPTAYVLDAERWVRTGGAAAGGGKLWFASKIPYAPTVFTEAARDIRAALQALAGKTRKLVVVDLDETLWGGIVGEIGFEALALGGHDHRGEAFAAFQGALKALTNRGIQLGIASKNEENVALEAIDKHPEMLLRRSDFAGWRINWEDKAANVAALADELNLGLDAVVFIDDHPVERARVREALPQVLVPEWPKDPAQYVTALAQLRCFDTSTLSSEDRGRAAMYAAERERRAAQSTVGSTGEWLKTLDLRVEIEALREDSLARSSQLLNKTNQMNLTTRRLSEEELRRWPQSAGRGFWTIRVADRFGDAGLVGLLSLELDGPRARIIDFVLSCRVMGRMVEDAMLHFAVNTAREMNASELRAEYVATERNRPCLAFLESTGLRRNNDTFIWNTARDYSCPEAIRLLLPEIAA